MIAGYVHHAVQPTLHQRTVTDSACCCHEVLSIPFDDARLLATLKELNRFCRELARKFKAKRKRNKSTCPTALLTPKLFHERTGWALRPSQKASTYG